MTLLEASALRVSRRKYLEKQPEPELCAALNEKIAQINAQEGLHIQLIVDGAQPFQGFSRNYGLLTGVQSFFALVGRENDAYYKEKLGYFGELLVLEATRLGLASCWVGGSYRKGDVICDVAPGEKLACVIALGYAEQTQSGREKFIRNVTHRKQKSVADMMRTDGSEPPWFLDAMHAVTLAPSGNNRMPTVFLCENGEVRATVPGGGSEIDLGIAKLHFLIGAGEHVNGEWGWGEGAFRLS